MIERSTPDVGYLDPAMLAGASVSQRVKAGGLIHYSGIVAATGQGEAVAVGDFAGQLLFVLEILRKLLALDGLTLADVVTTTTYCRDMEALKANGHILAEAFRDHHPTSTWVQVGAFTSPDYLLELVATAAVG